MTRRVRKRWNTTIRRRQIADATRMLIIRYGSGQITVSRIAREIGVSGSAIYKHFGSKRDILALMLERAKEDLVDDIDKGRRAGQTPLQVLDDSLRNHVSSIEQRRGVYFQVIAETVSLGDRELNEQASAVLDEYVAHIRDLVSEGVKTGEIRHDIDPDMTAVLITSTIKGMISMWALSNCVYKLEQRYLPLWGMLRSVIVSERTTQA